MSTALHLAHQVLVIPYTAGMWQCEVTDLEGPYSLSEQSSMASIPFPAYAKLWTWYHIHIPALWQVIPILIGESLDTGTLMLN